MPQPQCSSGESEPRPCRFAVGQTFTFEIFHIFPSAIDPPENILRLRELHSWGGHNYWDCTEQELLAVVKA